MLIDSYMPVKIISGKNCFAEKGIILSEYGKKCIIVTGKASAVKSGALNVAENILSACDINYVIFNEVEPNPETVTCKRAGDIAREFGAEFVLGIGGGSVLDASKAIAIFAKHAEFSHDAIYNRNMPSEHLPVILVGITSGTGSEVTGVSVLTNSTTKMKKSISGADCYADISFCDYSFSMTVDVETRISTALDAFCHAIESYVADSSNDLSQLYSIKALMILGKYLLSDKISGCLTESDFEQLYIASLYAGMAINISGTCFPHTVGYYLTENFNVPHGKACAVFVDALINRIKKYCPHKMETISKSMNADADFIVQSIRKYTELDVHISESQLKDVCNRWNCNIKNFDRTPGGYSAEQAFYDLKDIIC